MVKEYEQDFAKNELQKRKNLALIKLSVNENGYELSETNFLVKKHRIALKEGARHSIAHCSYQVGNNIGSINFVFKDEVDKLRGIASFEEKMPKFTIGFCKKKSMSELKIVSKLLLM